MGSHALRLVELRASDLIAATAAGSEVTIGPELNREQARAELIETVVVVVLFEEPHAAIVTPQTRTTTDSVSPPMPEQWAACAGEPTRERACRFELITSL